MSTLNRNSLEDGSFAEKLQLPPGMLWSAAKLEESLAATLLLRPAGELWVFAYGSLMWNPLLHYVARENAVLEGWHRSFCLKTVAGRGSNDRPGRMLALEAGGRTEGVALKLDEESAGFELKLLWAREMVAGSYEPRWERITLQNGATASALVFVVNKDNPHYEPESAVTAIAPLIATAGGSIGSNAEYVCHLDFALADAGLEDSYVDALVCELKRAMDAGAEAGRRGRAAGGG